MFGLNPIPMYLLIASLFCNVVLATFWQFADSKADRQEAIALKCAAEHKATVALIDAMGKVAREHAKQTEVENAKIADETAAGWAAAFGVVRSDAAKQRLRDAAGRGAGSGAVPQAVPNLSGDAQAGADAIPSAERIAQDCAETTVTANYLQSYIERIERESP